MGGLWQLQEVVALICKNNEMKICERQIYPIGKCNNANRQTLFNRERKRKEK